MTFERNEIERLEKENEQLKEFIKTVLDSVKGGGDMVTFMPHDIEMMEQLITDKKQ